MTNQPTQPNAMKTKHKYGSTPNPNIGPVTVALPNTTEKKMAAIEQLSRACYELAVALNSTNVTVQISNCTVVGAQTGINVKTE